MGLYCDIVTRKLKGDVERQSLNWRYGSEDARRMSRQTVASARQGRLHAWHQREDARLPDFAEEDSSAKDRETRTDPYLPNAIKTASNFQGSIQ
jgi:hypothetical protein